MRPNEWGDFLAGFIAPLALLWLVVGYFQQGEELRLNTEALKAQQEELRQQVEATVELAGNARRQAAATELSAELQMAAQEEAARQAKDAAQPLFILGKSTKTGSAIGQIISNRGASITDVQCEYNGPLDLHFPPQPNWEFGQDVNIAINGPTGDLSNFPIFFDISYKDGLRESCVKSFSYELGKLTEVPRE